MAVLPTGPASGRRAGQPSPGAGGRPASIGFFPWVLCASLTRPIMTDRSVNVNPLPDQTDCHIAVILGVVKRDCRSNRHYKPTGRTTCAARRRTVIARHRVSPSASPITGSSGVSSTLRLLDSIAAVSGILDRPVKPGDDGWEYGAA